ncbi:ras-related protein rab-32 [Plakobranchus ocellatus]|uniref:Ras-related protein rab-32 n=1 Tax=Plakobranchus ocellatus TaxID=259542 RepID=A0AAV3Z5A7_9GAST|nr:ras-related protein rab-32 [Plakobranchus ocellatus]
MDDFCKEKGFIGWYETSAKENINIDEAARFLVTKILEKDKANKLGEEERDRDRVVLDSNDVNRKTDKQRSFCC